MEIVFTKDLIRSAANKVWSLAGNRRVFAFHGAMGVGKTTFIHALCDELGVQSTVGSPTYAIINEYVGTVVTPIYHMDWYRLRDEEEALNAGVEDTLLTGHLCLVEWPERAEALLPDNTLHLYFELIDEHTRKVSIPLLA